MLDGAEILMDEPLAGRGIRMLQALADTAPAGSVVTRAYAGKHRLLVLYGVGLAQRLAVFHRHIQSGGHVACWDIGYWDRDDAMRLSIDSLHPTEAQLMLAPRGWRRSIHLQELADPKGPILLVGIGSKSASQFGLKPMEWESAALGRIRRRHGAAAQVWFRPKGKRPVPLGGTTLRHGMPIEEALRGASLVVCKHSNVAVDACIAGIPAECEDGAARALYRGNRTPTAPERAEFLRQLSFWNYRPKEAAQAWGWIERVTA